MMSINKIAGDSPAMKSRAATFTVTFRALPGEQFRELALKALHALAELGG